ncbi:MAG: TonB-dependent hemoglobin/transferrin/lactoferrin family receptor [Gammaproteobacteria bacterium]|nr:TonB-dependent hemoglobin/transferrin/lactoferrin family receptor [Gammaproteobacteria bacterium]
MSILIRRAAALSLFLMPALAPAQASVQQTESNELETITVVATRTERALEELAATVSVKTAEEMERELAQDIADLVRFEPGVSVGGTGSRFGLNGFNIRGIGGNRVLTLVDGVRVAEEFSFGPFLSARRDFVDIDSLSRVEIARGPISSLYGSDALGGVVALSTKQPADYLDRGDSFSGSFKGSYSGADEGVAGTISLAGGSGPVSGLLVYTRRDGHATDNAGAADGFGPTRELPDPQSISNENLTAKLVLAPSDRHKFTVSGDIFSNDSDTRILSDYETVTFGTTVNKRDANDSRDRTRWSLGYRYSGQLPVADTAQVTVYQQDSETVQRTAEDRATRARAFHTRRRDSYHEQEIRGAWIQLDKSLDFGGVDHFLTYGADYYVTENASLRDGGTVDASGAPVRERFSYPTRDFPITEVAQAALFAQDEIAFMGGDLLISPGIRWDRFEAEAMADAVYLNGNPGSATPENYEDSQFTAKLGAVYSIADSLSVYGRYSEGFRAPPYDDVNVGFTNFLGGYKTIASPGLESERSEGLEIGLRFKAARGYAEIAVFRNDYENFIESLALAPQFLRTGGVDPADGLRTFQSVNRDRVEIQGWEIRGSLALGPRWSLRAAAAGASGEDLGNGEPLNGIEPLNVVLGLGYAAPGDRWGADLVWTLVERKDAENIDSNDPRPETAGYGILDLMAYARFGERVQLSAGLFNLADKAYVRWADTGGIGDDAFARFTQPGLNASVTLSVDF